MTATRCLHAVLVVVLAAGGCRPRLSRTEQTFIQAWLLCDDCRGGERQRVAGLGGKAVPTLASALLAGPPAERRANMAQQLRDLHDRLGGEAALGITQAAFVSSYLDNYITTYRARSAISLGDIPTGDAAQALQQALAADSSGTAPLPFSVRLAVQGAVAAAYPPFTGSLSDSSVAAFDTVTVRRGAAPWSGDETVSLLGGPFPADLLLLPPAGDSLRFLAVGLPGRYAITIDNEGPGPVRAPLVIHTFRYTPLPSPGGLPNLASRPFPQRIFLALGPPPAADTIARFLFFTSAASLPRSVTATADWRGAQDVDLSWISCAGDTGVGNVDGITPSRPERTTVSIPASSCWYLVATGRGPPGPPEIVKLDLTSP